jgi:hypothetical protein
MARASTYFYDSNNPDKQTLHRRIRPSDTQFNEQQSRWNALKDFLLPELNENSGYPIRSWLQGSYKFGTQIRPLRKGGEFDIDLGLYFCWKGKPGDGDFGPKRLKDMVQGALEEFAKENDDVTEVCMPKPRCCRIRFDGAFHIDVPCYHLDADADQRALATEDDEWECSDPKALYKWFTEKFEPGTRDRARRHTRYLKAWSALKFDAEKSVPPSSVLLTTLVANAISDLGDDLPATEDEAFTEILRVIRDEISASQEVFNPANKEENFAARISPDDWLAFVRALEGLHDLANDAIACATEVEACSVWAGAFGHLFPLPEEATIEISAQSMPAVRTIPEVAVTAISRDNARFRYSGANSIGPIPKNCDISFQVTNAVQMPAGTRFKWVVRNEGSEAEDANDLGHVADSGTSAKEHSAYNGTHYMDCTAFVGNRAVGVRRVKVTVRGQPAPRRQKKKPTYPAPRRRR